MEEEKVINGTLSVLVWDVFEYKIYFYGLIRYLTNNDNLLVGRKSMLPIQIAKSEDIGMLRRFKDWICKLCHELLLFIVFRISDIGIIIPKLILIFTILLLIV